MKKKFNQVYQLKIQLKHIRPPIWRRIQVPETYTFWDLHVAIQDAMGWEDEHLHEFEIPNPSTKQKVSIGVPNEDRVFFSRIILPEEKQKIADWFSMENKSAIYTYDFGDNWVHKITLEKILPRDKDRQYPQCIAGKRACPPEDCGGVWGYYRILEALKDPQNEEFEELLAWLGDDFDPENFDPEAVYFTDPDKHTIGFF